MIKNKIWEVRTSKNYSLTKLANKSKISKSTLNRMENGQAPLDLYKLEKIADALGCKIEDLYEKI